MGTLGLNFQNKEFFTVHGQKAPTHPDTCMFSLYNFWPRFSTFEGERQWFWSRGILLLSWVIDFQRFDPNYLHNLGHPRPYFSLPKHSDCNHSKQGYFRLAGCMVFSALEGFVFFFLCDSVFIINRVGSAFPETERDSMSLTLNVDINSYTAPWPVPRAEDSWGQAGGTSANLGGEPDREVSWSWSSWSFFVLLHFCKCLSEEPGNLFKPLSLCSHF